MLSKLRQRQNFGTLASGIILAANLTGCATKQYPITSPFFRIPSGTRIVLNETLTIPPNTARVYLQFGKVISAKEKDRYQPNCWFRSWKVLETPQIIQPDTFIVIQTQKNEDYVQNISNLKTASASVSTEIGVGVGVGIGAGKRMDIFSSDAPMAIEYTTQLTIHSESQSDIRRLACSHWDDTQTGQHLTVEQMQSALGKIATIYIDQVPSQIKVK